MTRRRGGARKGGGRQGGSSPRSDRGRAGEARTAPEETRPAPPTATGAGGRSVGPGGNRPWVAAVVVLLFIVAVGGWLLRRQAAPATGGAGSAVGPVAEIAARTMPGRQVIFVGLDGADWAWLDERFAAGDMPALERLAARGVRGVLRSEEPLLSPLLWTTMMTGVSPLDHRILDFTRRNPDHGEPEPITSSERARPAIWNMATAGGREVAVYGLWATWPAEAVAGEMVSDRLFSFLLPGASPPERLTWPPEAAEEARRVLAAAEERFDRAGLRDFLPWLDEQRYRQALASDDPYADPVAALRRILVQTEVYFRLAVSALEEDQPDLTVLYVEGTDAVGHWFAPDLDEGSGAAPEQRERFAGVPATYFRHVDRQIERLAAIAERQEAVLVFASDHGFRWHDPPLVPATPQAETAPLWHHADGMYLLVGEGLTAPATGPPGGTIRQVAPSLLALLGLPPAAGIEAAPLPGVPVPELPPADYAAHYRPAEEAEAVAADEELAKLRALGYVGATGGGSGGGSVEGTLSAPALANQALLLQEAGRLEEAVRSLRASLRLAPDRPATRTNLGIVLSEMGRHDDAVRQLAALVEEQPDSPQARINLARALSLAGRWEEAVAQYDELLRRHPDETTFRFYRATALRQAGRPRQAAAAFHALVERHPGEIGPRVEEAAALAAAGDHRAALARLEAGLAVHPQRGELVHAQARLLATAPPPVADARRALSLAEAIYRARPEPAHAETLAMALAANDRHQEAAELQQRLLAAGGDEATAERLRANLERYRAGRPAATAW